MKSKLNHIVSWAFIGLKVRDIPVSPISPKIPKPIIDEHNKRIDRIEKIGLFEIPPVAVLSDRKGKIKELLKLVLDNPITPSEGVK